MRRKSKCLRYQHPVTYVTPAVALTRRKQQQILGHGAGRLFERVHPRRSGQRGQLIVGFSVMMIGKMRRHHVAHLGAGGKAGPVAGKYFVPAVGEKVRFLGQLGFAGGTVPKGILMGQPVSLGTGPKAKGEFAAKPLPGGLLSAGSVHHCLRRRCHR